MIDAVKPWLAWGAVGAVLAGLVALAVMNPVAAVKLASAVSGWLLDTGRAVVNWCRDPKRNWWKVGCFSFGGFFAIAAFLANEKRLQVDATIAQCVVTVQAVEHTANQAKADAGKWRESFALCQTELAREVGLQDQVDAMNAAAVAAAQAEAKKARRELADFKKRYAAKPQPCTAALAEVEKQCASLSDY